MTPELLRFLRKVQKWTVDGKDLYLWVGEVMKGNKDGKFYAYNTSFSATRFLYSIYATDLDPYSPVKQTKWRSAERALFLEQVGRPLIDVDPRTVAVLTSRRLKKPANQPIHPHMSHKLIRQHLACVQHRGEITL